jgi:hypothetical protein
VFEGLLFLPVHLCNKAIWIRNHPIGGVTMDVTHWS